MGRRGGGRCLTQALAARTARGGCAQQRSPPTRRVSAWVGASAGSGKTKVLTDRVLRLLLRDAQAPSRILCLTFTKAAAAEMATRLARKLGDWAVRRGADAARRAERRSPAAAPTARARCGRARLFAEVLELPGGMRISTIHAFCQSLLRAFPLEAGLPPQFGLLEDADAATPCWPRRGRRCWRPCHAARAGGAAGLARLVAADALLEGGAAR